MLFWTLIFLQILFGLVYGESSIRQTPEGEKSLDALKKSGLFFLKWRAYSDYKKDLKGLQKTFGITALILTILLFVIGSENPSSLFNALPGLFLILWFSMQFGTNFKKTIKEQMSIPALLIIGPWLILGLDYLTNFQFNQLRTLAIPFNSFQIHTLENYQIATALSIFGGITGVFMAIISIVIFSIVPLFFLFLTVFLSRLSRGALQISPNLAKNISLFYCFIIGPILLALESKGII